MRALLDINVLIALLDSAHVFHRLAVAWWKREVRLHARVAYAKESIIVKGKGKPIATSIPMEDLKLLQELEESLDIEDAWRAREEPGENISWEELKEELYV